METVKLGLLIKKTKVARCGEHSYPVLSITKQDGIIMQSEKFKKRIASADTSDYKIIPRGKLVQGIHIDEGNFGIQDIVDNGIVSPAYGVWDINDGLVIPKYLEMVLRSPKSIEFYRSKLTGTVNRRGHMSDADFLSMDIPLPDRDTQSKILKTMKQTTSVLYSRQQQLAKLDELIKARFVEMFGDPYTNSKDYPLKKGESFFKLSNGKAVPESKRLNGGIPAYGGNGISWYTDESLFDADTIVVGRVGFQSGNVHLVKGPLWVTDNAMYMSSCDFSQYNLTFLIELMAHVDFTKFQDAGDLKKITQRPFMQFEYLCPPLSLQNQFADFVAEVDKSKLLVGSAAAHKPFDIGFFSQKHCATPCKRGIISSKHMIFH